MKWFQFRQNNSGGSFDKDEHFSELVLIQANSPLKANSIAEDIGIYFDGVRDGRDCDCCGDRWHALYSDEKGDDVPSYYGQPLTEDNDDFRLYPHGFRNPVKFSDLKRSMMIEPS